MMKNRKSRYCLSCETHFKASPQVHGAVHHTDEIWQYIDGSYDDDDPENRRVRVGKDIDITFTGVE